MQSTPQKASPTRTTKHDSRPSFLDYNEGMLCDWPTTLIFPLETYKIIQKHLDWDVPTLTVMSVICDSIAYGKLAKKLPRSTNTVDLIDLLLGDGGPYVPLRSLEKVLGYSTSTYRRAFEGRSQDDSILYMKYKPNTTKVKLDQVIVTLTNEFIERKAPMKSWPPVRIVNGTFKNLYQQYRDFASQVQQPCAVVFSCILWLLSL